MVRTRTWKAAKPEHDSFGRLLAYVEYAGSDLGSELIENGYVWPRSEERHPRLEEYEAIGESARAAKLRAAWVGWAVEPDQLACNYHRRRRCPGNVAITGGGTPHRAFIDSRQCF